MRLFEVSTVCTATVEELWVLAATDEEAAIIDGNPQEVLTLLAEDVKVIHVENTGVRDEEDRHVLEVREVFV